LSKQPIKKIINNK